MLVPSRRPWRWKSGIAVTNFGAAVKVDQLQVIIAVKEKICWAQIPSLNQIVRFVLSSFKTASAEIFESDARRDFKNPPRRPY